MAYEKVLYTLEGNVAHISLNDPATRNAIETFQKKNGLAVTGKLEKRTARLLTSRSGISIP